MLTITRTCLPEWVDYNGHMRDAYYVLVVSFRQRPGDGRTGVGTDLPQADGLHCPTTWIREFGI